MSCAREHRAQPGGVRGGAERGVRLDGLDEGLPGLAAVIGAEELRGGGLVSLRREQRAGGLTSGLDLVVQCRPDQQAR
jgi:hypothetical protein